MKFTNLKASSFLLGDLEHPNKMPFSGCLTYFDVPSDMAPHGSGGRKVLIPSEVGVPALDSLVGMAVNLVDGREHAPQDKIGIITSAEIGEPNENGTPVLVQGFIYAHDFPEAALDIKMNQSALGFSYETTNTLLQDGEYNSEAVAIVTQVVFTGASILYAADAAYTTTTLAASAETGPETNEKEGEITMEQVEQILAAIQGLKEYVDTKFENFKKEDELDDQISDAIEDAQEAQEDAEEGELQASNEVEEAPTEEPVAEEEKKEEEAPVEEAQEEEAPQAEEEPVAEEAELNAAAELAAENERLKKELAELKASADLQASARKSIAYPVTLMAKYQLSEEEEATKLMASIDNREDLSIEERLALKIELREKQRKQAK